MLVPYDGDDWYNLAQFHKPFPKVGAWNPIKVLPEDSLPMVGIIAAYWVMPFIKDYLFSIALTAAAVVSLAICVYLFLFSKILEKHFTFKRYEIYGLTLAFFLAHFWIMKASHGASPFLFGANDLTCFFHYVIPALVNLCLVEYFVAYGLPTRISSETGILRTSFVFLAMYLAIFSNLMSSIILIAFIAAHTLLKYKMKLLSFRHWIAICKENYLLLGVLVLWIASIAFEMTGGRAHSIHTSLLNLPLKQTLLAGWQALKSSNKICLGLLPVIMGISFYFAVFKEKVLEQKARFLHLTGLLLVSSFFTMAYLFLACARTFPGYIGRPDLLIGPGGLLLMAVVLMAAFLFGKKGQAIFGSTVCYFCCIYRCHEHDLSGTNYGEDTAKNLLSDGQRIY